MAGRENRLVERREEVLDLIRQAAIEEFAENGLRGASTKGIADRAGISKTRLHYYIASKEDLYREVLAHITRIWSDLFEGIPTDHGPRAFLREYIARKVRFSIAYPNEVQLFAKEVMCGAPFLKGHWGASQDSVQRATQLIENWIEEGHIRRVDPVLLQIHIWAMTEQYALMAAEVRYMLDRPEDAPLDANGIIAEITDLVLYGLAPAAPQQAGVTGPSVHI